MLRQMLFDKQFGGQLTVCSDIAGDGKTKQFLRLIKNNERRFPPVLPDRGILKESGTQRLKAFNCRCTSNRNASRIEAVFSMSMKISAMKEGKAGQFNS